MAPVMVRTKPTQLLAWVSFGVLVFGGGFAFAGQTQAAAISTALWALVTVALMGRKISVVSDHVVVEHVFGVTKRFPVHDVRGVSVNRLRLPNGGEEINLNIEWSDRGQNTKTRVPLPFRMPASALQPVLVAIAERAANVQFDHLANRIRMGQEQ